MSEPLPPRHGEDEVWTTEPKPICPECGGLLRRHEGELRCDVHGFVVPEWELPDEDER